MSVQQAQQTQVTVHKLMDLINAAVMSRSGEVCTERQKQTAREEEREEEYEQRKKRKEDQRKNDRKREREFNDTSQRERGRRSQEYIEVTNYM